MHSIILQASDTGFSLLMIILIIAGIILLFVALRAVVLWYWKIDQIVTNQEEQINALKSITVSLSAILEELRRNGDR